MIDRHILPFKPTQEIKVNRDIRFRMSEIVYSFAYYGQIKEEFIGFDKLKKLDLEKLQLLLVKGGASVENYHIKFLQLDGICAIFDFDMEVFIQFEIVNGILDTSLESLSELSAEFQWEYNRVRSLEGLSVLN